jgi:hypothetical protein
MGEFVSTMKTPTLDLASALENTFKASLTAAAIKLANRATKPACVTCHASSKLNCFSDEGSLQSNCGCPLSKRQDRIEICDHDSSVELNPSP